MVKKIYATIELRAFYRERQSEYVIEYPNGQRTMIISIPCCMAEARFLDLFSRNCKIDSQEAECGTCQRGRSNDLRKFRLFILYRDGSQIF